MTGEMISPLIMALVWPHLEYCSVLDPTLQEGYWVAWARAVNNETDEGTMKRDLWGVGNW